MNLDSTEKVKEKITEQDKLKEEFKKSLIDIKQKYGVKFDVDLLNTNNIDKIRFYNLKYKNKAHNVSLIYYNEYNYYGAYIYTLNKNSSMLEENYITKRNYLNKEYKLELVINEIKQANQIYRTKLNELEKNYQESSINNLELEKKKDNTDN